MCFIVANKNTNKFLKSRYLNRYLIYIHTYSWKTIVLEVMIASNYQNISVLYNTNTRHGIIFNLCKSLVTTSLPSTFFTIDYYNDVKYEDYFMQ